MSLGKRVVVFIILVVSCLTAYGSRPTLVSATAGINSQISFTGKMVKSDNTNITDGTYNVEFKIYQNGTNTGVGGALLWTEDYLVAGSTGMPTTGGVTLSSGTFSVNLASICAFAGGVCGAKTNTAIDFNQDTLWVSVQIGNSTSCTVTAVTTSFNAACGGDGEMSPYIRLTAVPYASNAALLSGIAVTALGQLASNQTYTGTNIFQPTTNISSATIKQTSVGAPTADIFNVQTANATTLLQFTGPSANASNIVLQSAGAASSISIGTNAIANTIQIGDASTINTGNTQTIAIGNLSVAGTSNVTIGAFSGATAGTTIAQGITALTLGNAITPSITVQGASAGTIGIGNNAVANTIQIGQSGANAVTQAIAIGNGGVGSTTNVTVGNTVAGTTTIQNSATINLNAGTIVGNTATQSLFNTVATSASVLGAATGNITFGGAAGNTTFGNAGAYTLQGVSGQNFTVNAQGAGTLSLDTGSTGTVNVGTGAVAKTITIGDASTINTGNTQTIAIGNLSVAGTSNVTIGAFSGATAGTTIAQGITALTLGNAITPSITVQGASAGTIGIGNNAVANTIQIGQSGANAVTQAIAIGNGGVGSTTNVLIGSAAGATAGTTTLQGNGLVTVQSFTAGLTIDTVAAGQTTSIDNSAVTHTLNIATGAAVQTVKIGSLNTTSKLTLQAGANTTTTGVGVIVGSDISDTTQINFQLDSSSTFTETASTCSTTVNQGALYYNTTTNAVRGCINGNWDDLVSTTGLGLLTFGVVPDSGSGAGDIGAIVGGTNTSGPCRVSFLTTTTVKIVQGCTAYSGGRKVIIPDGTTPTGSLTFSNNNFVHVCLTGTNNQPAFSATGIESANMPTFSVNSPVLCLADIRTTNSAIASIYDVRTFTTTNKTFATLNAITGILGGTVTLSATANVVQLGSAIAQINASGVAIVTAGSVAVNNTINMIIATGGMQYVKATGTSALGSYVQATATAGYTSTAAVSANAYSNLGVALRTIDTLCTLATNCQFSQFTNIDIK